MIHTVAVSPQSVNILYIMEERPEGMFLGDERGERTKGYEFCIVEHKELARVTHLRHTNTYTLDIHTIVGSDPRIKKRKLSVVS